MQLHLFVKFSNSHRIDLYKQGGFKKLIRSLREALKGIVQPVALRSQPINNLAREDMQKMLKERNFFDCRENWKAEGIQHIYKRITSRTRKLVIDHTTGLLWQQSGSKEAAKNLTEARNYITALNNEKYGGYDNWRLPTLEEAMSLTEPMKNDEGLCINTDFDGTQDWIWTADQRNAISSWTVNFNHGYCNVNHADWLYYIRAAHWGQLTIFDISFVKTSLTEKIFFRNNTNCYRNRWYSFRLPFNDCWYHICRCTSRYNRRGRTFQAEAWTTN